MLIFVFINRETKQKKKKKRKKGFQLAQCYHNENRIETKQMKSKHFR